MRTIIAALCLALCIASPALASNDDANPCGNHGNNCCTEDGGTTFEAVETTCSAVVNANPQAYCGAFAASVSEARAKAICGDATANCNGGTAFSLALVTHTCKQTSFLVSEMAQAQSQTLESSNTATQTCGDAAATCGDAAATCTCPAPPACPDVEVGTRVLKCRKVKELPNGRVIRKGCLVITEAY